jgi:hypothetical protein
VTFTITVHEAPAAKLMADICRPVLPVASAPADWFNTVGVAQLPVTVLFNNVMAAGVVGKVSLTAIPVTVPGLAAGLVKVKVSVVLPPASIGAAKALVIVGGAYTVKIEFAATALLPPLVVVTAPMAKLLVHAPPVLLVTKTVIVQKPAGGMVPPVSTTLGPFVAAVTLPPPQVVDAAGAAALVICIG